MPKKHVPRLGQALRALFQAQRVAALGTLDSGSGAPFVSLVPFALVPGAGLLALHLSALAAHTANVAADARVSLLVAEPETPGAPVHALPRVSLEGLADTPAPESAEAQAARTAYLARFPEAALMTELADFRFVTVQVISARQVAGFGAARSLDAAAWRALWA